MIAEQFSDWWNRERADRPEHGTVHDICPTNGLAVLQVVTIILLYTIIITVILITKP